MENMITVEGVRKDIAEAVENYVVWRNKLATLDNVGGRYDVRNVSPEFFDEFEKEITENEMFEHMRSLCLINMAYYFGQIQVLGDLWEIINPGEMLNVDLYQEDYYRMRNAMDDAF